MNGQNDVGAVDGGGFDPEMETLVEAGLGTSTDDARSLRLDGPRLVEQCQPNVTVRSGRRRSLPPFKRFFQFLIN